MNKIILSLIVGLSLLYSSEDFKDLHLKCTLKSKGFNNITERQAESLDEYNIDVLVTKIDLKVGNTKFIFEKIYDYKEIYSRLVYDNVYEKAYVLKFPDTYGLYINTLITRVYNKHDKREIITSEGYLSTIGKENIELEFKDRMREREEGLKYECTEATFIEKMKYIYDKW